MPETRSSLPLSAEQRAQIATLWNQHPGMKHMGVRVDLSSPDVVRVFVDPLGPEHRGGMGTEAVNGAVIAGVFDLTIGLVGHFHTQGRRAGTVELHMHFLRPVHGERFEVLGRLVRAGRTLVFAAADLFDETGELCARCDGIVAVSASGPAEWPEGIAL